MASRRLPGKALLPVGGMPLLELLLRRVARARHAARLLVATTARTDDDAIAALARKLGVPAVRGPEDDVLTRYALALEAAGDPQPGCIVRVTGDNPLTDPVLLDAVVDSVLTAGADYSYAPAAPLGTASDAFSGHALRRCHDEASGPFEREHINGWILANPALFRRFDVEPAPDLRRPDLRVTIDTPDDLARVRELLDGAGDPVALDLGTIVARWDATIGAMTDAFPE